MARRSRATKNRFFIFLRSPYAAWLNISGIIANKKDLLQPIEALIDIDTEKIVQAILPLLRPHLLQRQLTCNCSYEATL